MTNAARIKNRIRRLRFDNDEMTQEELANRAGCTRQTIIALEQGKYVPSIELAFRIAKAFGVRLEDVITKANLADAFSLALQKLGITFTKAPSHS